MGLTHTPSRALQEKKKNNVFFRVKKNLSEKAVTSKAGKAALKVNKALNYRHVVNCVDKYVSVVFCNVVLAENHGQGHAEAAGDCQTHHCRVHGQAAGGRRPGAECA